MRDEALGDRVCNREATSGFRGAVEEWLSRVEDTMATTLHKLDAPTAPSDRLAWCRRHASHRRASTCPHRLACSHGCC